MNCTTPRKSCISKEKSEYKDLLGQIEFYREYFSSPETKENVEEWRRGFYSIHKSEKKANKDCPVRTSETYCRKRSTCGCEITSKIRDSMTNTETDPVSEWANFCFNERYKNMWGQWRVDHGSAHCVDDNGDESDFEEIDRLAAKWVDSEVWRPNIWDDFGKDISLQLDNVLGYQLRSGDSCLTWPHSMTSCDDHNLSQQWTIEGTKKFTLSAPRSGEKMGFKNGIITSLPSSQLSETSEWFFENTENGSFVIRNHGQLTLALNADKDTKKVGTFRKWNRDWSDVSSQNVQEWLWQAPYMKMADNDSLCLGRPSQSTGALKIVNCSGESGYEHDWSLDFSKVNEFYLRLRGTDKVIAIRALNGEAISKVYEAISRDYDAHDLYQRWTMTETGQLKNVATGVLLLDGLSFEKYPTMLETQFQDRLEAFNSMTVVEPTDEDPDFYLVQTLGRCLNYPADVNNPDEYVLPCDETLKYQQWQIFRMSDGETFMFFNPHNKDGFPKYLEAREHNSDAAGVTPQDSERNLWKQTESGFIVNVSYNRMLGVTTDGQLYLTADPKEADIWSLTPQWN